MSHDLRQRGEVRDDAFKRLEPKLFAGLNKTPTQVVVTLPWPHKALSPNSRAHWSVKARAVKAARECGWALTLQALNHDRPKWTAAELHWEFHPKTRNTPDGDNAESSVKAYRDGIADALGMDDANFTTTKTMGEPVKGGAVLVTIKGR